MSHCYILRKEYFIIFLLTNFMSFFTQTILSANYRSLIWLYNLLLWILSNLMLTLISVHIDVIVILYNMLLNLLWVCGVNIVNILRLNYTRMLDNWIVMWIIKLRLSIWILVNKIALAYWFISVWWYLFQKLYLLI